MGEVLSSVVKRAARVVLAASVSFSRRRIDGSRWKW